MTDVLPDRGTQRQGRRSPLDAVCGNGRSCERICPIYKPGKPCTLTLADFANLFA